MGKGVFEITPELLESVLLLPEGMKILKIEQDQHYFNYDTYLVMVEHEDIPDKEECERLPRVELTYQKLYDEDTDKSEVILSGWTTREERPSRPITPEELGKMFTE